MSFPTEIQIVCNSYSTTIKLSGSRTKSLRNYLKLKRKIGTKFHKSGFYSKERNLSLKLLLRILKEAAPIVIRLLVVNCVLFRRSLNSEGCEYQKVVRMFEINY